MVVPTGLSQDLWLGKKTQCCVICVVQASSFGLLQAVEHFPSQSATLHGMTCTTCSICIAAILRMSCGKWQEMVDRNFFLSEGFCGLLLSRCGEAHHIQLAEDWVGTVVGNPGLKTSAIKT